VLRSGGIPRALHKDCPPPPMRPPTPARTCTLVAVSVVSVVRVVGVPHVRDVRDVNRIHLVSAASSLSSSSFIILSHRPCQQHKPQQERVNKKMEESKKQRRASASRTRQHAAPQRYYVCQTFHRRISRPFTHVFPPLAQFSPPSAQYRMEPCLRVSMLWVYSTRSIFPPHSYEASHENLLAYRT
jgi:hypothetical protein